MCYSMPMEMTCCTLIHSVSVYVEQKLKNLEYILPIIFTFTEVGLLLVVEYSYFYLGKGSEYFLRC